MEQWRQSRNIFLKGKQETGMRLHQERNARNCIKRSMPQIEQYAKCWEWKKVEDVEKIIYGMEEITKHLVLKMFEQGACIGNQSS